MWSFPAETNRVLEGHRVSHHMFPPSFGPVGPTTGVGQGRFFRAPYTRNEPRADCHRMAGHAAAGPREGTLLLPTPGGVFCVGTYQTPGTSSGRRDLGIVQCYEQLLLRLLARHWLQNSPVLGFDFLES